MLLRNHPSSLGNLPTQAYRKGLPSGEKERCPDFLILFLFTSYVLKWKRPLSLFCQGPVPILWVPCTTLSPNSHPSLHHTHRCLSLSAPTHSFHHQKAGHGRVKHLSNPQQGPPHWLGNNGAISLYLTFAPAAFMTYSSPPLPAAIQPSISHPLPEQSCAPPSTLASSLGLPPPPCLSLLPRLCQNLPCLLPYSFPFSFIPLHILHLNFRFSFLPSHLPFLSLLIFFCSC